MHMCQGRVGVAPVQTEVAKEQLRNKVVEIMRMESKVKDNDAKVQEQQGQLARMKEKAEKYVDQLNQDVAVINTNMNQLVGMKNRFGQVCQDLEVKLQCQAQEKLLLQQNLKALKRENRQLLIQKSQFGT